MNIKIALIDTGIDNTGVFNSSCSIRHFSIIQNKIIEKYKKPILTHGTSCLKEILKQDVPFDVLDINVSCDDGSIKIDDVILGFSKAIELQADVINISLGFTEYSDKLYSLCQKAVENNIAVISAMSHTQEVSYPADFKNVIGVEVNSDQKDLVQIVDDSVISLKMDKHLVCENNVEYNFASSSMASAYFTGLFASKLIDNPVFDKFTILRNLYNLKIPSSPDYIDDLKYKSMELYEKIKHKKVAVMLLPVNINSDVPDDITSPLEINNVIAYYDHKNNCFRLPNGQITANFDIILIINSSQHEITISENLISNFSNYEILFLGKFKNIKLSHNLVYDHTDFNNFTISKLTKPVILIAGVSWSLGKFALQKSLVKSFSNDNFSIKAVTYNPLGSLYHFDIFNYPSKVTFPDIVCSINNYMCCVENTVDLDAWVIDVGGGLFINNFNKFSYGKLIESYFQAASIDILVLCVPAFVELEMLQLNINRAYTYGIKKIFLVISKNTFEGSTMHSIDALRTYKVDSQKYRVAVDYIRQNFDGEVLEFVDAYDGELYRKIINLLS